MKVMPGPQSIAQALPVGAWSYFRRPKQTWEGYCDIEEVPEWLLREARRVHGGVFRDLIALVVVLGVPTLSKLASREKALQVTLCVDALRHHAGV